MRIARVSLSGPGAEGLQVHQDLLIELNARKEKLETELVRQMPEMNLDKKLRNADRHVISEALPQDSALVEFVRFTSYNFEAIPSKNEPYWGEDIYAAFVLLSEEPNIAVPERMRYAL